MPKENSPFSVLLLFVKFEKTKRLCSTYTGTTFQLQWSKLYICAIPLCKNSVDKQTYRKGDSNKLLRDLLDKKKFVVTVTVMH